MKRPSPSVLLRRALPVAALALAGGCGGEYRLTAPDVPALPGENAPVVARLQRREFWFYWPPIEDAAITFRCEGGAVRCARTDEDGFAVVALPAPDEPGAGPVTLLHQDGLGRTVSGRTRIFSLSPDRPVVAVDMDALPAGGKALAAAADALGRLAQQGQMIYLTQDCAAEPRRAREALGKAGMPAGAVVPWRRECPWYARNPFRRQSSCPVKALRQHFANLRWGVSADAASAERFHQAGLEVLAVGDDPARIHAAEHFKSWAELTLPAAAGGK